jgi:RNA polymerase sigma-70 factor (ECF subfamily)
MEGIKVIDHEDAWGLVQKIKAGDREAFMTLTRMYQKKVFILTYSFFRDKEDALDLVQETFLRLVQKIDSFRPGHSFEAWLLQIAKNLCIDHYRRESGRRRELERDRTVEEMNAPDPKAEGREEARDLKEILSRCVAKLAERQRLIFIMRHYNQLKNEEIAQALGISIGTVKSLHFKAVRNLRALMSPYLGWET